jgi:hypothetical protein
LLSLPSFPERKWLKEFESWDVHDDDDPSSLVLSSEHLFAITIPDWNAIEINKMLDNGIKDVAMARWGTMELSELLLADVLLLIVWLLITILKLREIMLYLFLLRF